LEGETDPLDSSAWYFSHLWQRQPACCSTIFTCSPAKQLLCRYQNTKEISHGAETPDVHMFFFFVACFRFPCSFFVFEVLQPSAKLLTVLPVSQPLKKFQGI